MKRKAEEWMDYLQLKLLINIKDSLRQPEGEIFYENLYGFGKNTKLFPDFFLTFSLRDASEILSEIRWLVFSGFYGSLMTDNVIRFKLKEKVSPHEDEAHMFNDEIGFFFG